MKWKIWPRQYGKTYDLITWWAEAPTSRVILVINETMARHMRWEYDQRFYKNEPTPSEIKSALKHRIVSFRTWLNTYNGWSGLTDEIAIDDLQAMLDSVFHTAGRGSIAVVCASGKNDEPNPQIKAQVDEFNEAHKARYPPGFDGSIG